jgi:predicted RNA-binding protein with PUA-like domain
MAKWLMKTEPKDYSWDRLVADGETDWTGVRNPQASANLRAMKLGEEVFFYRSVVEPAIVGIMTISAEWTPDPRDPSGKRGFVKVKPLRPVAHEVSLRAIKTDPRLSDLALVRQSRLSVLPVSDAHWAVLLGMAGLSR